MSTVFFGTSAFLASFVTISLAIFLLINRNNPLYRPIAFVLLVAGLQQAADGMALIDYTDAIVWKRVALLSELLLPAALLYTGLALMRIAALQEDLGGRWRIHAIAIIGGALCLSVWFDTTIHQDTGHIVLGSLGRVDYIFIVFGLALSLAQFEQVLRGAREPLRYQLKFILIGLGAFVGYRVYESSRFLLFPIWQPDDVKIGSLAVLFSIGLVFYGLRRLRFHEIKAKVYVAPQFLYGSVTFLVIGCYLFAVGVVGELLRYTDQSVGSALSTLLIFVAIVALIVVLSSRTIRSSLKRTISRYFYRVKYDYRSKWLEVTQAFLSCASVEAILDRFLDVLSTTFGAGRISVWIRFEADKRFHQVRSINTESAPPPLEMTHPLIDQLGNTDGPLALEQLLSAKQRTSTDAFWESTKAVLCAPLRSEERLVGFVTLSQERGMSYGADDADLLRAISHHVTMLLSLAELAEERRAASELEALHRFSAFCLHDIKNLAARLSLVMQNAEVFGHDPTFQQSAMRTVGTTVQKMTALITKLSRSSGSAQYVEQGAWEVIDLQALLSETIDSLNGGLRVPLRRNELTLPPIRMKRDQIQQVLLNVILNAQQACGERGSIDIDTVGQGHHAVLTVSDNGPGISGAALRTLFHPFQSTKKEGLGIGLYECRRIIESHQGTMSIESEVGRGTSVRITLPFASEVETPVETARIGSEANA